jgi:hypothetical protein
MTDSAEQIRIGLGVTKDGLPAFGLLDKDGKLRFEILLDKEGNPVVTRPKGNPSSEKPGRGTPLSIQGGFEHSQWQQNSARCCAGRERLTLVVSCLSRVAT